MNGCSERPPFYLTAYGLAVKHGFQGTEEEWINEQRTYVDAAETAADAAEAASGQASGHAAAAAASASDAAAAAGRAGASARSAAAGAAAAAEKESEATAAALAAKDSKETASSAATAAASCAESANASKNAAQLSQQNAAASASAAAASASSAEASVTMAAGSATAAASSAAAASNSASAAAASAEEAQVDATKASDVYLEFYGAEDPDTTDPSEANQEINIVFHSSSKKHSVYCMVQQVNEPVLFLRYSGADYEQIEFDYSRWIHHFTQVIDGKQYDLTLTAPAMPIGAFTPYWGSLTVTEFAPLASPAFTGTPTAPTPASGDSSTKIATTAFVQAALGGIKGIYPCTTSTTYAQITAALAEGKLPVLIADVMGYTMAYVYSNGSPTEHQFVLAGWGEYYSEGALVSGGMSVSMMICSSASVWTQKDILPVIAGVNGTYTLKAIKTSSGVTYEWVADNS